MSKRKVILLEIKLRVVKKCINQDSTPHDEAKQLGIHTQTVLYRIVRYKANGSNGLKRSQSQKLYSTELQQAEIQFKMYCLGNIRYERQKGDTKFQIKVFW